MCKPWIPEKQRRAIIGTYSYSDEGMREALYRQTDEMTKPFRDLVVSAASAVDRALYHVPELSEVEGELFLGDVMLGDRPFLRYGIKLDEVSKHIFVSGPTGTGKTVFLYNCVQELARLGKPFTIMDTKLDFHFMLPNIPNLVVIHAKDFRMNLFDPPPNVNIIDYLQELRRIFPHAWGFFQSGSGTYLSRKILEAYHRRNDGTVTLYDVAEALQSEGAQPSKKSEWHTVVNERIMETLDYYGPAFATRSSFPLYQLLDLPLVVQLSGMGARASSPLTIGSLGA